MEAENAGVGAQQVHSRPELGRVPESPQAGMSDGIESLWTRKDLAAFLRMSLRWVDSALTRAPRERGSIPHVELPTRGRRRQVRFIPDDIRKWLGMECPPAEDFKRFNGSRRRK